MWVLLVVFGEGGIFLVCGPRKKKTPASRDGGPADVLRPGLRDPARCQFLEFPEKDLPDDLAFIEVNRGKLAPGRLNRRVAILVFKAVIAGDRKRGTGAGLGADPGHDPGLVARVDIEPSCGGVRKPAPPICAAR